MTKFAAILLLSIHLCSSICHSFIFNCFINLSDERMIAQLDNHVYKDADLVEVAVPLNMPYITNQTDYERYDGEIEFNGTHYNYVKRMVNNDTLHLLCLPNGQKTQLYTAKNDYAKQLIDMPSGKKSSESSVKKSAFLSEYSNQIVQHNFTCTQTVIKQHIKTQNTLLTDCFIETPGKPPQVIA